MATTSRFLLPVEAVAIVDFSAILTRSGALVRDASFGEMSRCMLRLRDRAVWNGLTEGWVGPLFILRESYP